jgi:hypothetical protein
MNDPWWKSLSRLMWLALTRILGPLMALGWPLFCAYGLLQPRALDLDALRLGRGEVALPIGSSSAQRSYVVLPRAIPTASVSIVSESSSGTRTVTENPGDAVIVLLVWVASVYCTWYFWVRAVPKASNQRLERP